MANKNKSTEDGKSHFWVGGFDMLTASRQMEKQEPILTETGQRFWKVGGEMYEVVASGGDSVFGGNLAGQHSPLSGR